MDIGRLLSSNGTSYHGTLQTPYLISRQDRDRMVAFFDLMKRALRVASRPVVLENIRPLFQVFLEAFDSPSRLSPECTAAVRSFNPFTILGRFTASPRSRHDQYPHSWNLSLSSTRQRLSPFSASYMIGHSQLVSSSINLAPYGVLSYLEDISNSRKITFCHVYTSLLEYFKVTPLYS